MSIPQNSIPERQNEPEFLKRMSAAIHLYTAAKRCAAVQAAATVLAPLALSITSIVAPQVAVWSALYSLLIAILDPALFDRVQKHWKEQAATLQELFDCDLFELPWNALVCGERPSPELIHRAAERFSGTTPKDWYPVAIRVLTMPFGRLICQRSSVSWDSELRRRYVLTLRILSGILGIAIVVIAFALNLPLQVFILSLLAPAVPIVQWMIKEAGLQQDSLDRLDRLSSFIDQTWEGVLKGEINDDGSIAASRQIQDQLYLHRESNQPIQDWIYRLFRPSQEGEMQAAAEVLVEEALAAAGSSRRPNASN